MIDERLKSANISVIRQVKTAKQAEDYLSGVPDRDALEKAVAEWWKKYTAGEFGCETIRSMTFLSAIAMLRWNNGHIADFEMS